MGKTANTKYAAQMIAEHIQGWIPMKATDPDSQQLAELRQRFGDDGAPDASTLTRPGQVPAKLHPSNGHLWAPQLRRLHLASHPSPSQYLASGQPSDRPE